MSSCLNFEIDFTDGENFLMLFGNGLVSNIE